MSEQDVASTQRPSGRRAVRVAFVPLTFLVLAVLLWADLWPFTSPVPAATRVPDWAVDVATVRRPTLRPEIELAGYTYRCSECHNLFHSPSETTRSLTQHRHVALEHGMNTRCFNCHHLTNRDAFVDDWGREIPYDKPQLLCAKCHGPVYRDWLHGSHGRTNGYWRTASGPMERKKCIECHDPHRPPFPSMKPAPPPNTLRMGDQSFSAQDLESKNPLRVHRRSETGQGAAPTTGQAGRDPHDVGGQNR